MNAWKTMSLSASLLVFASQAQAVPLLDHYIGGHDNGYGDVIGNPQLFDTHRAEITRENGRLTIDIFTNFVGNVGVYPSLTNNGKGIGYGDLFISSAWTPFVKPGDLSTANVDGHIFDNALNGTQWTYGLSFDDPWSTATGGSFSLFKLNGTNDQNLVLSEELFKPGAIIRQEQAVQVDRNSSTVELLGAGTWTIDAGSQDKRLSFDLDLAQDIYQEIASYNYLAMHWGMTCNNDAIEGGVDLPPPTTGTVPEPTTLSLLGLAMIGLLRSPRRQG